MKLYKDLFRIFVIALIGFKACISEASAGELRPTNLTCNYKNNPIGIDSKKPVLSWIIVSGQRGIKQTAYQVLVSDRLDELKKGKGDIWNTGKINLANSIQVSFSGKELQPAKKYYWQVRVWDNKGNVSGWSEPATWQMGLLTPTDWKGAHWIAYNELPASKKIVPAAHLGGKKEWGLLKDTLPLLRREFTVEKPLEQAIIFISGLGHFELSVNKKKIGDHFLDPGWTNYNQNALYIGFDLTNEIKTGKNALGVMLGNGFYHVPAERYRKLTGTFGYPKMICRLVLKYKDGTSENIVSNQMWKVAPGPVTFSSIYGGEDYDATLEQEGWNFPSFNDTAWKNALLVKGPHKLNSQETEPLKVMETFTPVKISQPKPGIWVYDLGQNFSGIPAITVKGKRADTIKIIPGEILDSNTVVSQRPSGGPAWFTYILRGEGAENWQPQFTYYGFRYLQVERAVPEGEANPQGLPVVVNLKGLHTRNSAKTVGSFSCSNELFNKIFKLIDWSIKSNMASVLTDCPHREKLGWLEVPHLLGSSVRYNYDIATFYRKIIKDMQMSQTEIGLVPNIAPEWVQFDPDFRDSPEWGSSSVILPWYMYQWYGDKEILKESYPMMKRYVDYLGTKAKNHIVSHGLGDWFDIGPTGSGSGYSLNTPQGITGTAMYYYDLNILSRTAAFLGKNEDATKYKLLSKLVRSAFNDSFFNKVTRQYGTGSQAANAMAVYMQLVEPQYKDEVVANIIKDIRGKNNRLTSGEVGYRYLIDVLEAENKSDIIYDMNSRSDVPGYGYQIAHGATTLMEDWTAIKTLGNNHCMLGHLMRWFYSGPGGIRPAENSVAFNKIIICPEPVGDITAVKASYNSPYGIIYCEWQKSTKGFEINVEIPPNTDATIYLPAVEGSKIFESGKIINGGSFVKHGKGKWVITVGSGKYRYLVSTAYVEEKQPPVSIIPLPQSLQWTTEKFDLKKCNTIILKTASLEKEARYLQQMLAEAGNAVKIIHSEYSKKYTIELNLGAVKAGYQPEEAYSLQVKNDMINLTANSVHGIFNGLQTLYQLMDDRRFVQGCRIEDYPAYKWRGYMVDVGRNYQSIDLLKQQVDMMARYKLNVFHFHLTEDIAWRLQIKQYPQLTAPEYMERNKGKYYSIEQMRELIQYCKDRYITLVPEIDMPGHSAAFTRAMGVGMQTEKGFEIVKDIIKEVCTTYDIPYIHIGADEVKITNEKFLPEISRLIQQYKKTVIGWAPGGNYDERTIHQLWKDEGNKDLNKPIKYIDSRFLYISDFDPMNSVVTIFNRQLGEKLHGDQSLLGAEFCLWSDRRVKQEADLINMNPVYPAMLAFSERSWRGGGFPGIVFSIGTDSSNRAKAFVDFETRLLDHKQKYFRLLPFNYVKQTHIKWNLFGPFENNGNLLTAYWPENQNVVMEDSAAIIKATGGTVWLWHTHGPLVKAWIPSPKENTTWYAYTRFWSNADSVINMWADFKDQSKSGADATPPKGEWDYMQSKLWINDELIRPPQWTFPGRKAGLLEDPLVDEGFYYRSPMLVKVKKGWNKILVKLPINTFNPLLDWQVPPKWMFTVIPVHKDGETNYSSNEIKFEPDNRSKQ